MKCFKKVSTGLILLSILCTIVFSGCRNKNWTGQATVAPNVTLNFYGLFDNNTTIEPFIDAYKKTHPNVTILYKKFTDPSAYWELIINELAEGEGPDLFMMQNTAFAAHHKKLAPAPNNLVQADLFRSKFVEVTSNDLIIPDENGIEQVWGMPLYVDTLALYYNDAHFEDAIPEQGEPSDTWDGIKNDVVKLSKQDQSFERFKRAGIAMGRADNVLRAFDILITLMLQEKTVFYNKDLNKTLIGNDSNALEALSLYTSFGLPSYRNYSWNKYLADAESGEKELSTFAKGKLSMLIGYSYTYSDLLSEIKRLQAENQSTINPSDIKIKAIPQMFDPKTSEETRAVMANYFVPVVSRTSKNTDIAWDFLVSMTNEETLKSYHKITHRPSAMRSLIEEQSVDPIYGVFAKQVGFARSLPMPDPEKFKSLFLKAIDQVLSTARTEDVLRNLGTELQTLIPASGIKPTQVAPKES